MRKITIKSMLWAIVPLSLFCTCCCGNTSCCTIEKQSENMNTTCQHCGGTSCDLNCSASNPELKDSIKHIHSCSLDSQAQEKRFTEIRKEIFSKSIRTKELRDGLEFTFQEPTEFNKTLLEFIEFERGCCKDFTFSLYFEPRNGPVTLRMTGSSEIKEMIKSK